MPRILLIFTTFLSLVPNVKASDGCRNLDFLDCVKDKALANHTVETFKVLSPGLEQCQHKCFMNDACASYNLGPIGGWLRTCELSYTNHVSRPDHVVSKEGAEYCAIKNPCSSSSCAGNEICKPDFSWDTFQCVDKESLCRQVTRCPVYRTCVTQPTLECKEEFSFKCTEPLGMEDSRIPDSAITSSSDYTYILIVFPARLGRLNYPGSDQGWSAGVQQAGEYLQVDLGGLFYVTKVATQGKVSSFVDSWVTTYTLKYSRDGTIWLYYLDSSVGDTKVFQGNTDETSVVEHVLSSEPVKARFVRFVVLTWNKPYISMRVELYGCKV